MEPPQTTTFFSDIKFAYQSRCMSEYTNKTYTFEDIQITVSDFCKKYFQPGTIHIYYECTYFRPGIIIYAYQLSGNPLVHIQITENGQDEWNIHTKKCDSGSCEDVTITYTSQQMKTRLSAELHNAFSCFDESATKADSQIWFTIGRMADVIEQHFLFKRVSWTR